jgi:hypothetical protein
VVTSLGVVLSDTVGYLLARLHRLTEGDQTPADG